MFYLLVFAVCLIVSLASTWGVRNLANTRGWTHKPNSDRHMHTQPVPRLGGVAMCGTLLLAVALAAANLTGAKDLLPAKAALGLLGPALIVFLLGLRDDLRPVSARKKLLVESVAAVWLYAQGFGIHDLGWIPGGQALAWVFGLALTVLWVLLITNACNLIDGLDGLAAGSALLCAGALFAFSLTLPNPLVAFLTCALAGATMGFLRFNFHPATIFLGDSGSLLIGFLLAALALTASQQAPTIVAAAIPVVLLGLPLLDLTLAVTRRFVARKPLFSADKQHIHHKLVKLGLAHRDAVLVLYAVSAGFALFSLILLRQERAMAFLLALTPVGILAGVQRLRYPEFDEVLSALGRVTRQRQVLANHVAIRNATESLRECEQFHSICDVLGRTLPPIGFDAIRLEILHPNGFAASLFHPFRCAVDGSLLLYWSMRETAEPPWELRLELVTSSREKWGYLNLVRMSTSEALALDINFLAEEFRTSLADALQRACAALETSLEAEDEVREMLTQTVAAGR